MLPVFKLIQCKDCLNTENNKITLCSNKSYKSLHEVQCVKCNNIWLMCALHGIRFKYRRYFLAKEHVRKVHHPSDPSTLQLLSKISTCQLTSDNDVVPSNEIDSSGYDFNDNIDNDIVDSESDNISNGNTTDSMSHLTIMNFKNCHKPITLNDYNTNMRRYIENESTSPGSGLKRIVSCAFTMNLSSDPSLVSINEALFHLKSTLF